MIKSKHILSIIIVTTIIFSCNQKKETTYSKKDLNNDFTIEIPSDYFSYGNNENRKVWKSGETSFLFVETKYSNSSDLNKEIQEYASAQDSKDLYKNKRLVNTENFENENLKGIILFYKSDVKGKGAGLVTLTSYITFAVVQSNNTQFNIESMTLSDDNFDEISKSIKSISSQTNSIKIPVANSFDKNKAIEEGYQVFQEDGFMVKCKGELKLDRLRIQQMKEAGMGDNSRPYHVYNNGTDYNINISSFEEVLFGKTDKEIEDYNKNDLDYYQTKFDEMSIKNNRGKFKNYDAVYYENTQDNRLTKAVFFHHKKKSYMLQVTDNTNVEKKFSDFIDTFEIIN
ncbi:hypothetical protein [Polaribacter sp.]|uniref:hypothetical protein n=1 Tax=Polaribacter sp. TaxID=1920175 RepID=UPI0040486F70